MRLPREREKEGEERGGEGRGERRGKERGDPLELVISGEMRTGLVVGGDPVSVCG